MLRSTPAVRATLVALVVSAALAAVGGGLHLAALRADGRQAAQEALHARVALVAGALESSAAGGRAPLLASFAPFRRSLSSLPGEALALVDADGRLLATTHADRTGGVPWAVALRRLALSPEPQAVVRDGQTLWVSAQPVGASGYHVAAVRPAYRVPNGTGVRVVAVTVSLWALLASLLVLGAYTAGPLATARLRRLGEALAQPDTDPDALLAEATQRIDGADAFGPLAQRVRQLRSAIAGAREHVGALYQVNPHYVLLCTMDGRIVEANPAFYAITGLAPDALRGGPVEALAEVFPVEPLMEFAERSLREGASIGGIEYAVVDREDGERPVEVALRAFPQGETTLVLFQATDVAVRRTLERRVAAFSDTLDLMVDQRVQQLAAGQQSLRRILDAAGVAVASFDRGGATRRWSGAAQELSGLASSEVPHFAMASASLGLSDADSAAFGRWFWSPDPLPWTGVHAGADGRVRVMVWHKVEAERAGSADHRTVVGMEVPADAPLASRLAAEALHGATGDGAAGDGALGAPRAAEAARR